MTQHTTALQDRAVRDRTVRDRTVRDRTVRDRTVQEAAVTKVRSEQCVVSATPQVAQGAQPGVLPAGAPLRFDWRGRTYRVVDILGHWLDNDPWWRGMQPRDVPQSAADVTGIRYRSRRVWQVEATNTETAQIGVYELAQEADSGQWWLLRLWD